MHRIHHRLYLIMLLLGIIAGSSVVFFDAYRRELLRQFDDQRGHAVQAVRHGQFDQALLMLRDYATHMQAMDVDTLYHFARAELGAGEPDGNQLVRAERLLRQVVSQQPDHLPGEVALLIVQKRLGFDLEAVATADRVLALASGHPQALQIKAKALMRLNRFDAALETAKQWVDVEPESVAAHGFVLDILHAGPWPTHQVTRSAEQQSLSRPHDSRFEVLLARAYRMAGDTEQVSRIMQRLAEGPLPSAEALALLIEELEAAQRFDQALSLLRQAADVYEHPWIIQALAWRLWALGHDEELITWTGKYESTAVSQSTPLLALQAAALIRRGRSYWAQQIMADLERRQEDRSAQGWLMYLADFQSDIHGRSFEPAGQTEDRLEYYRRAVALDPLNPVNHLALGDHYRKRDSLLEAIESWSAAAEAAPYWAEPRLRLSQAMIDLGLGHQAIRYADEAQHRAPGLVRVRVAVALARALELEQGRGDSSELLELVRAIQNDEPGEPRTLPLYASLLARQGQRESASGVLLAALEQSPTESTLIQLARVSHEQGLGLSQALFAQSEQLHGRTPQLIHAHAWHRWRRGRLGQALAELMTLDPPTTGQAAAALDWRLAQVRFLDAIGSPQALVGWQELAAQHPDNLGLHQEILRARVTQNDRALQARAIARLHALTGDDGLTWRLAQARWLLQDATPTDEQIVQAALLLGEVVRRVPQVIDARLLIARCFTALDNEEAAMAHLRHAHELAPRSIDVALQLADLLVRQDNTEEVDALLGGVVNHADAGADQLQAAAALYVQMRQWEKAAAALTRAVEAGGDSPDSLMHYEFESDDRASDGAAASGLTVDVP